MICWNVISECKSIMQNACPFCILYVHKKCILYGHNASCMVIMHLVYVLAICLSLKTLILAIHMYLQAVLLGSIVAPEFTDETSSYSFSLTFERFDNALFCVGAIALYVCSFLEEVKKTKFEEFREM